jgi:hypothetical protein
MLCGPPIEDHCPLPRIAPHRVLLDIASPHLPQPTMVTSTMWAIRSCWPDPPPPSVFLLHRRNPFLPPPRHYKEQSPLSHGEFFLRATSLQIEHVGVASPSPATSCPSPTTGAPPSLWFLFNRPAPHLPLSLLELQDPPPTTADHLHRGNVTD